MNNKQHKPVKTGTRKVDADGLTATEKKVIQFGVDSFGLSPEESTNAVRNYEANGGDINAESAREDEAKTA